MITVNGTQSTIVQCGHCSKVATVMLPDGSIQIQSRHDGQTHFTILTLRDILKHAGKRRVEEVLKTL